MNDTVKIGGRAVGAGEPVLIVAEIGVNHMGDAGLARELIDAASEAGADAVKFQSFSADRLVRHGTPKAPYQRAATGGAADQYEMLRSLELGREELQGLKRHCEEKGLIFISTPFDPERARELAEMGVSVIKIGSADLTDALLLEAAAEAGVPLILSTGMSSLEEIGRALYLVRDEGASEVVLLHCVSAYPAEEDSLNLRFISTLRDAFECPVGFSDHTGGVVAAPLAAAAGACLIEKHLTLDRTMEGPDHEASLEKEEMRAMVEGVREAERMLGTPGKELDPEEMRNAALARKSLVFALDLPAGTHVEREHLASKRPADGISPMDYRDFTGRVLSRPVSADDLVREELFRKDRGT
jgi:sialic acid synthase SpsE